jgi:hypothetical protein
MVHVNFFATLNTLFISLVRIAGFGGSADPVIADQIPGLSLLMAGAFICFVWTCHICFFRDRAGCAILRACHRFVNDLITQGGDFIANIAQLDDLKEYWASWKMQTMVFPDALRSGDNVSVAAGSRYGQGSLGGGARRDKRVQVMHEDQGGSISSPRR